MTMEDNEEAIRTMVMNVVLFLPFGLILLYVFNHIKNKRRKWLLCILIGFLVSVGVESIQYVLALGRAETDDVICNTLECALGGIGRGGCGRDKEKMNMENYPGNMVR